jgi:hypothetical protein
VKRDKSTQYCGNRGVVSDGSDSIFDAMGEERERKDMVEKEIERNKGKRVCANFNLIECTSLTFTSCTAVLS